MKSSYIHPAISTLSVEPISIMAGSETKNHILMDTEGSSVGSVSSTLTDFGHTGNIEDARSKDNTTSIWE